MKILFIGAATSNHTIRWVNALSNLGHQVLLVSRGDQRDKNKHISEKVDVTYLKYGGGVGYYLNVPQLKKIFKKFNPDITNVHYATGYATLARLSRCRPLVVSVWGSDVYDFPFRSKKNKKLLVKNLNYADSIASTSKAMANKTREILNDANREITVTPFGVDIKKFTISERKINKNKIIGIVKYLEPIYDIPLLINAFSFVKKQMSNVELHIYGDGKLRNELEDLCRDLDVYGDVTFFGTIPNYDVPKALNSMDVFVNCSKMESFGVAIVEAMACGVPVVATNCEGFKEIIDSPDIGIIINERDPKLLADNLILLLNNPQLCETIRVKAYNKVVQEYDWSKNVLSMVELYNNTILKYKKGRK